MVPYNFYDFVLDRIKKIRLLIELNNGIIFPIGGKDSGYT